ncbi:FG-GAP repeat domain-containing protein [Planctomycetota bacterium]
MMLDCVCKRGTCRLQTAVVAAIVGVVCCVSPLAVAKIDAANWTHFTIAGRLPGSAWGTGGIPLADFDGDGDLDISLSRRETKTAYWFQRINDSTWIRHTIGIHDTLDKQLGATEVDCDLDGFVDAVYSRVWFKNPGNLASNPDAPWKTCRYLGEGHDILSGDINGDGRVDVLAYDGKIVSWYDPTRGMKRTIIGGVGENHGGTASKGIGDLDGDGDNDVVIPGYWFANPGSGHGLWKYHTWPHLAVKNASYGTSMRCWIADINNDGLNDIVYSDCDTGHSHVYWVQNRNKGADWIRHQLPDPPTASGDVPGTGSFHSLGVADFDKDGDLDIFAGEQEDPDTYMTTSGKLAMKPPGLKERGVIWENSGSPIPVLTPVVIHTDNPGWHDAVLGDVDGDGDIDIVTKVWNKDGASYHADYWRNDIR